MSLSSIIAQSFVSVQDKQFFLQDQPYYFLGTNFWYGMQLASKGPGGDRDRLLMELDALQALGVTNLRIMGAGEGPDSENWRMRPALMTAPGHYNADLLDGLDFLLSEMGKRQMKAVVCLGNFWPWSGGFAQYYAWSKEKAIPYPPPAEGGNWLGYMLFTSRFYKNKPSRKAYWDHIRFIVNRVNNYTGLTYRDDPTIMAWQLANEPRGMTRSRVYRRWIEDSAKLIKSLDANHLVTVGSEGNTSTPTGNNFIKDHSSKDIDYTTIHIWVQNWSWYNPEKPEQTYPKALGKAQQYLSDHLKLATSLNKPLVLEEFGISRDHDDHDATSTVNWRDQYYEAMFETIYQYSRQPDNPMAGCNFWAWAGKGRPRIPKAIWQPGDDWIGDPPHEYQGWYSVYDTDSTTLKIIRKYAEMMKFID
ncbi:MAG: endo-1,4-beta-mannosidase [Saprospiraceae bacterium]|nr:MAG: endo-1,4-beta-mannosidase [Saprospiraceae bacterium]